MKREMRIKTRMRRKRSGRRGRGNIREREADINITGAQFPIGRCPLRAGWRANLFDRGVQTDVPASPHSNTRPPPGRRRLRGGNLWGPPGVGKQTRRASGKTESPRRRISQNSSQFSLCQSDGSGGNVIWSFMSIRRARCFMSIKRFMSPQDTQ